jgi:hypothetical protein
MSIDVASHDEGQVARPLTELASLIRGKIGQARKVAKEAAEAATQPFWAEIGDLFVEARTQFNTAAGFYSWTSGQFGFSQTQTRRYLNSARLVAVQNRGADQSLSEALRAAGQSPRGGEKPRPVWTASAYNIADRARREAERIRQEQLTREQEREAQRELALKLISIGYKVLAKELHPDKGGSQEAMTRLHIVRARLKKFA